MKKGYCPLFRCKNSKNSLFHTNFFQEKASNLLQICGKFCNFIVKIKQLQKDPHMQLDENKVTEIFFILDEFSKNFNKTIKKHSVGDGKRHRNKPNRLSDAEVMPK